MKRYKAVILDIDGTLIPIGSTKVPQRVVQAAERLKKAGVPVIIATGRSGFVLNENLLGEFTADYYVCAGGSVVLDRDKKPLWQTYLTQEQMDRLEAFAHKHDLSLAFTFDDGYYVYHKFEELMEDAAREDAAVDAVGDGPLDGYTYDGGRNDRHLKEMPNVAVLHLVPDDMPMPQEEDLNYMLFRTGSYDVCRSDADKAMTTRWLLQEKLGIDIADCVAMGDGNNDIPLLQAAGLGVAMGNARPAALAAADMVTDTVDECGVATAIEKLFPDLF